jgi:hypothetical protein
MSGVFPHVNRFDESVPAKKTVLQFGVRGATLDFSEDT